MPEEKQYVRKAEEALAQKKEPLFLVALMMVELEKRLLLQMVQQSV